MCLEQRREVQVLENLKVPCLGITHVGDVSVIPCKKILLPNVHLKDRYAGATKMGIKLAC